MIAFLLALTVTFHPAQPSVGDLITVDFPKAPVVLAASSDYEVVSRQGAKVVVRTFRPKPFTVTGTAGGTPFRMTVPVRSVLAPNDALVPAMLVPPRAEGYEKQPFVLIAIAALLAVAAWTAVVMLARRVRNPSGVMATVMPPAERFRRTVSSLLARPQPMRWATLADALRAYLAATSAISPDLTTTEVLRVVRGSETAEDIAAILTAGDLEKFAPDGSPAGDFEAVAVRALELAA